MKILNIFLITISILLILGGITVIIYSFHFFNLCEIGKINSDHNQVSIYGYYGSFISGIVGTFWYLVGVIVYFIALNNQQKQLSEQFKEIQYSRIENNYFQLLKVHNEILNLIEENFEEIHLKNVKGKKFFEELATQIFLSYKRKNDNMTESFIDENTSKNNILEIYNIYFKKYKGSLAHYFRNLFHIIKYIDSNTYLKEYNINIKETKKYSYIRILRSILSTDELVILAYNSITNEGNEFIKYCNRYFLLKNLDDDSDFIEKSYLKTVFPDLGSWKNK
jgi:hypothetical protein